MAGAAGAVVCFFFFFMVEWRGGMDESGGYRERKVMQNRCQGSTVPTVSNVGRKGETGELKTKRQNNGKVYIRSRICPILRES